MAVAAEQSKRDYIVHVPARLLKHNKLGRDAKLLWCLLGAYADGATQELDGIPDSLRSHFDRGRGVFERAHAQLRREGWLEVMFKRDAGGRLRGSKLRLTVPPVSGGMVGRGHGQTMARSIGGAIPISQISDSIPKKKIISPPRDADDFLHQLAENFREVSPERLRWAVCLVAARAKTPPRSPAYFRKALPRVFENLQGETDTWLSVEAAKRLLEFPGLGLPDLAQDLKQLAAENDLPYGPENVTSAIDTGLRRVEEERELQSGLAVGRGPGARE